MSTWALIGSPNSGKTTLYNWLTGSSSKTVNYPGSTVEYSKGSLKAQLALRSGNEGVSIVDTPGVYSLTPQSEDEQVTHDVLFRTNSKIERVDGVIVVLDSTQLGRHLLLARQVKESGYPVIFVLTMRDLIEQEGSQLDFARLKAELGSEVIFFDGIFGRGLDELMAQFRNRIPTEQVFACPHWTIENQTKVIKWASALNESVFLRRDREKSAQSFSNKIDGVLMHPFFGIVLFFVFMTLLFSAVYWAATPAMDLIDGMFGKLIAVVTDTVPGLTGEFFGSGLVAAIGGVVIFVPQIFILFIGIGILESTGYLARVAALIDKPLTLVGLGGRSFVPLLSGFACAIPAIMATRHITSKKERLIAQNVIPFMTCSARLPVYALLIGFLYGGSNPLLAGFIMAVMYFGAILVGAIAARIIAYFIKDNSPSRLLMELPLYRRPRFSVIFLQALSKAQNFVVKAGPIIFTLAIVLWFATNFPRTQITGDAMSAAPSASVVAQQSYAAKVGRIIEPVFEPMGVDWRVGFGLISAFAAREVFVSSLALMFNVDSGAEEAQTQGLIAAMRSATFPDGRPIFTTASVTGILIFFMIALQCTSTVGILKREMGSWPPVMMQLVFSNLFAYGLAVAVVSVLKNFGY